MQSVLASSASPELVHWHDAKPSHLMTSGVLDRIAGAANDAIFSVEKNAKTLLVQAEHSIGDICTELGIHDFSHHIANKNLAGATLTLYSNGNLEIRREGQKHATTFPVQLLA